MELGYTVACKHDDIVGETGLDVKRFIAVFSKSVLPAEMSECNQCPCNNCNGSAKHEGPCRILPVDKVFEEGDRHHKDNDAAQLGLQVMHVMDVEPFRQFQVCYEKFV